MCGIYGISYGPKGSLAEDWTPSEFMQIMFPAIVHRGPHAYGWMYFDGKDIHYSKFQGRADTKRAIKNMVVPDDIKWLVCHVRYYTKGSPSNLLNNHPIPHGKIIGVHNGVIRNDEEILEQTGRENPKTEVDSEAIFAAISKWGHRRGLNKIRGDMVAVYANSEKPSTLHVARSEGRPLLLCTTSQGSKVFASEAGVVDATGVEHTSYSALSRYRLIRLRTGRVVERIDLDVPTLSKPRGMHGIMGGGGPVVGSGTIQHRASKRGQILFPRDTPLRESWRQSLPKSTLRPSVVPSEASPEVGEVIRRLQEARDPQIRNLQDHDQFGSFYYYRGELMDPDKYCQAIEEDMNMQAAMDQAIAGDDGAPVLQDGDIS